MKLLVCSALLMLSCASAYKGMVSIPLDEQCLHNIKPRPLGTSWYDTSVDVVGKHISGLLLVKQMPDSSTRVVFTNQAGVKFFDFEFSGRDQFRVYHVIPQLDRKVVVNLLRKDFELLLQRPFAGKQYESWTLNGETYFGVSDGDLKHYYVTNDCRGLKTVESGSRRKKLVEVEFFGKDSAQPDSLSLQHFTFAMRLNLKKINRS